jgi:hypothetical protein
VHVEILEGFGEVPKASDDGTGVCEFDETRRRLERGCLIRANMRAREVIKAQYLCSPFVMTAVEGFSKSTGEECVEVFRVFEWEDPRHVKHGECIRHVGREKVITPNGNRTRAACLEGKHDNHFTIGVVVGFTTW